MAAARAALATLSRRPFSISPSARLVPRRGLSAAADHHGPVKVNMWEDPLSPSRWKEEHFVLTSLAGWGLLIYGGYTAFSGGKKETKEVPAEAKQ